MSTTSVPGSSRADPAQRQRGLLVAGQQPRRESVAPLDLAEERLAVLRVADGARRDAERPLGAELLELAAVVGEDVADARDREGEEPAPLVDALAEPRDLEPANDLVSVPFASATSSRVEFVPRSTAATLTCAVHGRDAPDRVADLVDRARQHVQPRARAPQARELGLQLRRRSPPPA